MQYQIIDGVLYAIYATSSDGFRIVRVGRI